MVAGCLLFAAYLIFALGSHAPASDNLRSWSIVMLLYLIISILAVILVQIFFHVALSIGLTARQSGAHDKEIERNLASSLVEDEMDKLISLKTAKVGYTCAGIGFIVCLITLAIEVPIVVALHVLLGSFFVGSIIEGGMGIYFYERGVRNV